ncbi:hypothetical protein C8F04DRAFT_1278905 [Mycena alexandri]|uniref:Uncharacterized protein n=1 Tax=Mycena alexandri TaxID=1745969 RepID=A0AAD6WNF1_9AGAR|nr:hypothetical protein C8F04DRAFT_1278905 [Mycena alexandri]
MRGSRSLKSISLQRRLVDVQSPIPFKILADVRMSVLPPKSTCRRSTAFAQPPFFVPPAPALFCSPPSFQIHGFSALPNSLATVLAPRPSSIRAELHDQILQLVLPRAASFFLAAAAYLRIRVPRPFADPHERPVEDLWSPPRAPEQGLTMHTISTIFSSFPPMKSPQAVLRLCKTQVTAVIRLAHFQVSNVQLVVDSPTEFFFTGLDARTEVSDIALAGSFPYAFPRKFATHLDDVREDAESAGERDLPPTVHTELDQTESMSIFTIDDPAHSKISPEDENEQVHDLREKSYLLHHRLPEVLNPKFDNSIQSLEAPDGAKFIVFLVSGFASRAWANGAFRANCVERQVNDAL